MQLFPFTLAIKRWWAKDRRREGLESNTLKWITFECSRHSWLESFTKAKKIHFGHTPIPVATAEKSTIQSLMTRTGCSTFPRSFNITQLRLVGGFWFSCFPKKTRIMKNPQKQDGNTTKDSVSSSCSVWCICLYYTWWWNLEASKCEKCISSYTWRGFQ